MENYDQNQVPEAQPKASMDVVFNELRDVLSQLGHPSETTPSDELSAPPPPMPAEEIIVPSEPSAPKAPVVNTPPPSSDADFWSGNVLGWPTSPSPSPSPAPSAPMVPPLPEPATPSLGDQKFFVGKEEVPFTPPPKSPAFEKPALEGGAFSLDTPFINNGMAAPIKPMPEPEFIPPPEFPEPPKRVIAPISLPEPEFEPLAIAEVTPVFESAIPIPGTLGIDSPPPASKIKKEDDPLKLEGNELKPAGLIQVACFFPEGQERQAQQFVAKLNELGEHSKSHLKIEPVFVSAWSEERLDVAAWTKSSKLSGADIMFLLVFKKDINQIKNLLPNFIEGGIRSRVVAVEHLTLRTLYMDILIELERGR